MASYRRVSQHENAPSSGESLGLEASLTRSRVERLTDKATAIAWVVLAVFVARWTGFYTTILTGENANRFLLRLAVLGFGAVTTLVLYLTLYLPKVVGLKADSGAWNVYCPKVVPTITGLAVVSYLLAIRGAWPVYGCLTPLIFGTQMMGALMSLHFIPAGNLC